MYHIFTNLEAAKEVANMVYSNSMITQDRWTGVYHEDLAAVETAIGLLGVKEHYLSYPIKQPGQDKEQYEDAVCDWVEFQREHHIFFEE